MKSPFPYFGGKSTIAEQVWQRLGTVKQYIEPFCGSAAIMLRNPNPPGLEVVNDANGFIANFWRSVKYQPDAVADWSDYPVSHIDLGARHRWLTEPERTAKLAAALSDPEWPGDAHIAGWWLWGQCCWIGSGWCDWFKPTAQDANGQIPHIGNAVRGVQAVGKVPHVGDAGRGVQAVGKVPHISDAVRGVQAVGKVPHVGNAGMGVQAVGRIPHISDAGRGVFPLHAAYAWMRQIAERLIRVRVCHGDWQRCLNHHYGAEQTAVFLDPPYKGFCDPYGCADIAAECEAWARDNAELRIALCGHIGDYDLPGWDVLRWERAGNTYAGTGTKDKEAIWFSPACLKPDAPVLFDFFRNRT
jgi:hypothetical protein